VKGLKLPSGTVQSFKVAFAADGVDVNDACWVVRKRCFETTQQAANVTLFSADAKERRIPNKTSLERRPMAETTSPACVLCKTGTEGGSVF
jgi:hypothetical protein